MEITKESPLKKYRRQPKIFIDLPSKGAFYPSGAVANDVYTQLAVFSMTPNDDILFKTPDALINGQATVQNIKSCIPSILDPWHMPMIDLDTVLISIRLATYGPSISVLANCPHCKTENTYDIPLQSFIDHYNSLEYNDTFTVDNFVFKTRPLNYKEYTENQKQIIAYQRAINIEAPKIKDEKEKEEYEQRLINELADLNVQKMVMTITSVEIDGEVETDLQEIVNWIAGTDVKIFHALKKHIEGNVQRWAPQKKNVQCGNENCKKEHNIMVRLDQSDFFGKG
jgi:hypothetical protein